MSSQDLPHAPYSADDVKAVAAALEAYFDEVEAAADAITDEEIEGRLQKLFTDSASPAPESR